jgi:ABC-type glycerol-3-phosphate transport system substrate-binding protein
MYSGDVNMNEPAIAAFYSIMKDIADYSPPGAATMDRDQATFLFVQGRAAMIPTGSWDYSNLDSQAEGFDLGVADLPLPLRSDPKYGKYVIGPPTEADTRGAFPFGITKLSPNRELALDFLQYASSVRYNTQLNRDMFWLPVAIDPEIGQPNVREELGPFLPRVEGFSETFRPEGPGTTLAYEQLLPLFYSGEVAYRDFVEQYIREFRRVLPDGVDNSIRSMDQTLDAQLRFGALRRAALRDVAGARESITGEPQTELRRIVEAFAAQRNSRDNEIRVWVANYERRQENKP